MRKLYRPPIRKLGDLLKWVWVTFLLGLVTTLVGRWLSGGLLEDKGFALHPAVWDYLRTFGPWVLLVLLGLAGLTLLAWLDERRHQAREREDQARKCFDLLKPATRLRPEDLNFQVLEPGEHPTQDKRPFYEGAAYVARTAVPYQHAGESPRQFHEEDLVDELRNNNGFVLLGPPPDGKSHTLYEIVSRMDGYEILRPKKEEKAPDEDNFSLLLEGKRVVLLLDDLNDYVDRELDLRDFEERLGRHASSWVVASTCRDDPELGAVREAVGKSLKRFYDDIPNKLSLLPVAPEEKRELALAIGKERDEAWKEFPSLGHITMQEPMRYMSEQFEELDRQPEQRDILRALKLLSAAGVVPFTHDRLRAVLGRIFDRHPSHLGDCLDALAKQSFLRLYDQDPVQLEPAYLQYVVTYKPGRSPEDDFPKLEAVLDEDLQDHEGLFYLGNSYSKNLQKFEKALACYNQALNLRPDYSEAWNNKRSALFNLGRYEQALKAFDQALSLRPDFPDACSNKAVALMNLDRTNEAIQWLCRAWRAREQLPDEGAWVEEVLRELRYDPEECGRDPRQARGAWLPAISDKPAIQLEAFHPAREDYLTLGCEHLHERS